MRTEGRFDYIEIPSSDLAKSKAFFTALFGWEFEDWGPEYMSFNDGRVDGGFCRVEKAAEPGGVLLIFYSDDLERDVGRVVELGGTISKEIYTFPGGCRFHFVDPTGTEFAIWKEVADTSEGE